MGKMEVSAEDVKGIDRVVESFCPVSGKIAEEQ
jgi:hypothetical protein